MSNDPSDTTIDEGTDNLKQLRKAAEDGKAARADLAQARKENLFLRAGIDPEGTRLTKMLFANWTGEDVEELKTEARELGIKLPGATDPVDTDTPDPATQGFQQARNALTGADGTPAGAAPQSTPDPIDAAYAGFYKDLATGRPRDEAALEALNRVMAAGANGDKRVHFDPVKWMEKAHPSVPHGAGR